MRKGKAVKRIKLPDPQYNSVLVGQLINQVMRKGKKKFSSENCLPNFAEFEERV